MEWFKEIIVAIGGGSVALVGILTIFKSLFLKMFETGIESTFEKNLEKYKHQLLRSTRAYEILLEREMRFYERLEPIFAELVPTVQDLLYYMKRDEDVERKVECDMFRVSFGRYTELTKILKNEILIHQSYIPEKIFIVSTAVVKQMQDDMNYWISMAKFMFTDSYEKIDYDSGEKAVESLLFHITVTEMEVKKRLKELSGI